MNSHIHSTSPPRSKIKKITNTTYNSQSKTKIPTLSKEAFQQLSKVNLFKILMKILISSKYKIKSLKMNINNCLNFKRLKFKKKLFFKIRMKMNRFKRIKVLNFRSMRSMFRWHRIRIKSSLLHLISLIIFKSSLRLSKIMVIIIFSLIIIKEEDIFSNLLRKMMFSKR